MTAAVRYRALDAGLIRLAAASGDGRIPPWPDLTGETSAHVVGWRAWLQQVWAQEEIVEAIDVAAPDLARRVDAVRSGHEARPRRVRRAVESVVRYLLRMQARATPFGLFAGVAPVHLGSTARIGTRGQAVAVARPDAAWLAAVVTDLESRPEVLRRLRVVANNLGFARDGRWVLPWQQQPEGGSQTDIGEISLRRTRAVRTALEAARSPITVADLTDKVAAELPGTARERIEQMLAALAAQRVLITDLHPPMEATDPLGHVIEHLAEAMPMGDRDDILVRLRTLRARLTGYARTTEPRLRRKVHHAATASMAQIHAEPEPRLAVDLHAAETVELPRAVSREAESAAAALVTLHPHASGNLAWTEYHARFLDRYGSGAVVPLSEVTNAGSGLGFPAGYRDGPAPSLPTGVSERDRALLRLAQEAALDQQREVVLDEERLRALTPTSADVARDVAPHTELRFHLHASSPRSLETGAFSLVVAGAARQAGTLSGRFLHLLDPPDRERMTRELRRLPGLVPGARLAQLSSPPLAARTHNVARSPAVFPLIALGEHPDDDPERIALDDLAVCGDDRRLSLVRLSQDCEVEPVMLNAVEFRHATHPLARFLAEITTARAASCTPFAWGAAEALPFLPRLRYRRTVLTPARWVVDVADLPPAQAPWPQWEQAWAHLRRRLGLPDAVLLGDDDRRMRLELDEPAHLALLRRHVDSADRTELFEAPDAGEYGWIGGRAHEIVLPMAATHSVAAPSARPRPARPIRHPGHTPGASPWVYARLHTHPARHDAILTDHLPALLADWREGPPAAWWFLRYREPEPHLRLRLRLHDAERYGATVQRLGAWANDLQSRGLLRSLVLDTYHPEMARFGTGATLDAAEDVFAADSAAVLTQLAASTRSGAHAQTLMAASFLDLAAAFTGGPEHGAQWLIDHPPPRPAADPPREVREQALRLADPDHGAAALRALPKGAELLRTWEHRRAALATYRARLDEAEGPQPDHVLASLLHLHHVRMADIAPQSERACLRLARAAALARQARSERSTAFPR